MPWVVPSSTNSMSWISVTTVHTLNNNLIDSKGKEKKTA